MKKYTCLIIEDEPLALLRIKRLLSEHLNTLEILGSANSGHQAITLIQQNQPDLIFLDIQLPDMTGFDVLDQLDYQPWIIFTTAYTEYALKAFEKYSIDYLVKPIEQDRFDIAINKLLARQSPSFKDLNLLREMLQNAQTKKTTSSLAIKKKDKIVLVDYEDITFLNAEDKYVSVNLKNGTTHLMGKTLTEFETMLPVQFTRVHRSYIVNRNYVAEIHKHFKGKYILQLADKLGSKIKTGETYNEVVNQSFGL